MMLPLLLPLLFTATHVAARSLPACIVGTPNFASLTTNSEQVEVVFTAVDNAAWTSAEIFWMKPNGEAHYVSDLEPGAQTKTGSYVGHAFRVFSQILGRRALLMEHIAVKGPANKVQVGAGCWDGDMADLDLNLAAQRKAHEARGAEIAGLVHSERQAACDPAVPTASWSCIRLTSTADYAARPANLFGFRRVHARRCDAAGDDSLPSVAAGGVAGGASLVGRRGYCAVVRRF